MHNLYFNAWINKGFKLIAMHKINPFRKEFTHAVTMWAIFLFPITFLTVRHGVHISLFVLALMAVYHLWSGNAPSIRFNYPFDAVILLTFAGLFISVLLSQIFRGAIQFAAFDGPSRLLIAGIVLLFLRHLNIPYVKVLGIAIPVGLICVFLSVQLDSKVYWDGRYATYFVDPNTLGSQTFILGTLSLLLIRCGEKKSNALIAIQVIGGLLGIYVSIGSGSRGGWLTAPFIFLFIFFLNLRDISRANISQKKKMRLQAAAICISIITFCLIGFYTSDKLSARVLVGYSDVRNWLTGSDLNGSIGTRLSMWKLSFQLAGESLLFGYGEEKNMMEVLQNSPLNIAINQNAINTMAIAGPHSDILSKLLSAGLFGLGAYLSLLLLPFSIFWKYRNALDFDVMQAARIGLFYITGIFIAGLSNEQLSLKYLCTFYGLMIALLLAQVLHKSSMGHINSGPAVS
jgi:O-antigen ligase